MKFSKMCTALMLLSVLIFTIIMIIVFCAKDAVPDELIIAFFAFWGVEGGAMAWIKNTDTKNIRKKKKAEKENEKQ